MPSVYRVMTPDYDQLPVVKQTPRGLGVRVPEDTRPDEDGNVTATAGGMSVAPTWQDLPSHRIPRRLNEKLDRLEKDATGKDIDRCWRHGEGPFEDSHVTDDLQLALDDPIDPEHPHGQVVTIHKVSLESFRAALASTRASWLVDEE